VSCRIFRALPVLILCALSAAQTTNKSAESYKLTSIHVKGLTHLQEDKVIAASGLKLGQMAGEADFQQAAQKLGSTGLFSDLSYTYQYSGGGCDLELHATENDKLLPIIFENFVWFSDDELLKQLRARVALFDDRIPAKGDLNEQVAQALVSILHEHKISGEVQHLTYAQEDGPIQAYEYKVSFHPILIRNVDFPGATADENAALQAEAKPLSGSEYFRSDLLAKGRSSFLPVYQAHGYLKAQFGDARPRVIEDGARTVVDVSLPVNRGQQYKLQALEIDGHRTLSADELKGLVHLKIGEAVDTAQLTDGLAQIKKLYASKGYLFATIESEPELDDATGTATYRLVINEGDIYRMGDLSIEGLPEENANRMAAQWQMKKGDPFDDSYMKKFFDILYRDFDLRRSYEVASKRAINQQDKTVSVSLHFVPKS